MKTILDNATRQELMDRVNHLNENSQAQWGTMNVHQMVQHCILSDDMMQGRLNIKRAFIGRLLGKVILRKVLKDDSPFGKNSPTARELKNQGSGVALDAQKTELQRRIDSYKNYSKTDLVHPFFGNVTREQSGQLVYKHYDHHLRQFGV